MPDTWYTADGDGAEDPGEAVNRYIANHPDEEQVVVMRNECPPIKGIYVTNIVCPECGNEPRITCPTCGHGD